MKTKPDLKRTMVNTKRPSGANSSQQGMQESADGKIPRTSVRRRWRKAKRVLIDKKKKTNLQEIGFKNEAFVKSELFHRLLKMLVTFLKVLEFGLPILVAFKLLSLDDVESAIAKGVSQSIRFIITWATNGRNGL